MYSNRMRAEEIARREAAGEDLWTPDFDLRCRRRIQAIWQDALDHDAVSQSEFAVKVARMMAREGGWGVGAVTPDSIITARGNELEFTLDMLEAVYDALPLYWGSFQQGLNEILNEHRVAFRMVEGQMVSIKSDELHVEVIEPTLRLLIAAEFKAAHDAYLKALVEITKGDAGDAITDAATALQETLVSLGCKGNALGPLLKDAKRNGLLASHDQALVDGIGKFVDWASADRSTTGDAHSHSAADLSDAWLMVHVVGALIVRLADPRPRSAAST